MNAAWGPIYHHESLRSTLACSALLWTFGPLGASQSAV